MSITVFKTSIEYCNRMDRRLSFYVALFQQRWCRFYCDASPLLSSAFNHQAHKSRLEKFQIGKGGLSPLNQLLSGSEKTLNYRTGAKRPISTDGIANVSSIGRFAPVL